MYKRIAVLVSALLASLVAVAAPASAYSAHHSTGNSLSSRCSGSYLGGGNYQPLCLFYYHDGTGAIWGQDGSVSDLAGHYFKSGSGTGAGEYVKNNATAMQVEYEEGCGGTVWYYSGYSGNYDWAYDDQGGPLYYTYNEDASDEVCTP